MGERVAGLSSGTSIDGIDVAVADLWLDGGEIVLRPLGALEVPYTGVGQAFAEAAWQAVERFGPADLVASLGQTVFHWVENDRARGTLQLGQPAWTAEPLPHKGKWTASC